MKPLKNQRFPALSFCHFVILRKMTKWFWHCLHVKKGSSGSFGTLVLYAKSKVPRRVPKYQTCFCAFKPCKIKGFGLWYSGTLVLCLEYQNDFCYSVTLRKSKVTSKVTS